MQIVILLLASFPMLKVNHLSQSDRGNDKGPLRWTSFHSFMLHTSSSMNRIPQSCSTCFIKSSMLCSFLLNSSYTSSKASAKSGRRFYVPQPYFSLRPLPEALRAEAILRPGLFAVPSSSWSPIRWPWLSLRDSFSPAFLNVSALFTALKLPWFL